MKQKINLVFSLSLFLIVLFFWGQQDIQRSENIASKLIDLKEQESYVLASKFLDILKTEASPLIGILEFNKLKELYISKTKLGAITITSKNGQEAAWHTIGDADLILDCISRGETYTHPNPEEERSYYRRTIKNNFFTFCEYLKYFSNKIFVLLLIFLPLFISFQLFFLSITLVILLISVLKISNSYKKEKNQEEIRTEYSIKKPPSKINVQTIDDNLPSFMKELLIPNKHEETLLVSVIILFLTEFNGKTRKTVNKIFHIPEFKFVLD